MKRWGIWGLFLCLCPAANATVITGPEGQVSRPYQRWADIARVPTPTGTVVVDASGCPGLPLNPGCTLPWWPIYLDAKIPDLRAHFLHELGHQFDYRVMTTTARRSFGRIFRDPRSWRQSPNSLHEQFAEAYRYCARYRRMPIDTTTEYDYQPTQRQHQKVCALIRAVD